MTQFKYPHFLLGTVVAGLWVAGEAYATQSLPTLGPSVGHRPVMTNLVLATKVGPANGVITDSAAILSVGSTIELLSAAGGPGGVDVDGDEDKAGAYCVWYKVPAGGGTPVLIQDNGPTDRSCQYTIQTSDIGFKIKADVTVFSDTDKAQAKGYTLNPMKSLPEVQESTNAVVPAPFFSGWIIDGHRRALKLGNEVRLSAFENAELQLIIDDGNGTQMKNEEFIWSSSSSEITVNALGVVNFQSHAKDYIFIEAISKGSGSSIKLRVAIGSWFTIPPIKRSLYSASSYCASQSGALLPTILDYGAGQKPFEGGNFTSLFTMWGHAAFKKQSLAIGTRWTPESAPAGTMGPMQKTVYYNGSTLNGDIAYVTMSGKNTEAYFMCVKK